MKEPLKAGDMAVVVGGLGRSKSPNLGLTVSVGQRIFGAYGADHSVHGPVHRCTNPEDKQIDDSGQYKVSGWADFPDAWLKKIEPPTTSTNVKTAKELEA